MKETHVHVLEDGTVLEHTHGEQEHVHTHDGTHPHHHSHAQTKPYSTDFPGPSGIWNPLSVWWRKDVTAAKC